MEIKGVWEGKLGVESVGAEWIVREHCIPIKLYFNQTSGVVCVFESPNKAWRDDSGQLQR